MELSSVRASMFCFSIAICLFAGREIFRKPEHYIPALKHEIADQYSDSRQRDVIDVLERQGLDQRRAEGDPGHWQKIASDGSAEDARPDINRKDEHRQQPA